MAPYGLTGEQPLPVLAAIRRLAGRPVVRFSQELRLHRANWRLAVFEGRKLGIRIAKTLFSATMPGQRSSLAQYQTPSAWWRV